MVGARLGLGFEEGGLMGEGLDWGWGGWGWVLGFRGCLSKILHPQRPLALVGKLLQQLKKDTLQNMCEDLGAPVSGNNKLIVRIAGAM